MGAVVGACVPTVYDWSLHESGLGGVQRPHTYVINPAIGGSMESVLANTGPAALFVDFLHQRQEQETDGCFSLVRPRMGHSGVGLVPREQYDGVLLIDRVTPPAVFGSDNSAGNDH